MLLSVTWKGAVHGRAAADVKCRLIGSEAPVWGRAVGLEVVGLSDKPCRPHY